MAQFKSSLGDIIGSVGGVSFQRSSQGYTVKSKPIGMQPRTPLQTSQRSKICRSSVSWSADLDEDQRIGWNNLAVTQIWYNKFGDPYTPSGYLLYQKISQNRALVGDSLLLDAPDDLVVTALEEAGILHYYEDDEYFTVAWEPALSSDERLICWGMPNQSAGLGNRYNKLALIYVSPLEQPSPYDFGFGDRFGLVKLGLRGSCMVAIYNQVNGAISPSITDSKISVVSP